MQFLTSSIILTRSIVLLFCCWELAANTLIILFQQIRSNNLSELFNLKSQHSLIELEKQVFLNNQQKQKKKYQQNLISLEHERQVGNRMMSASEIIQV